MSASPSDDIVPAEPTRPPHGPWTTRVEAATLLLLLVAGGVGLAMGAQTRGYDYDEVVRAHSAWLAAHGLRPYTDFFECHPPYFALLIPIVRLFPVPTDLLGALRGFAILGNLLFLAGLVKLASNAPGGVRWAWLGLLIVAVSPAILDYMIEFRIDGWGYALLTWALVRFRSLPRGPYRDFELALLTGIATLVFSPKLVILPPLVIAFDLARDWKSPRAILRLVIASLGGACLAAVLVAASLWIQGIRFGDIYELLVRYHAIGGTTSGFRHGLLDGILQHWILAGVAVAGLMAWSAHRVASRSWPDACELAILVWLGLQVAAVAYPYKQYYAPWFLFAAIFVPYIASVPLARLRTSVLILAMGATLFAMQGEVRAWAEADEAGRHRALIRWMDRVAGPGDRVVGSPPVHPIDRHDAFFVWFNTSDPNGFDSERILARLPSFRNRVTLDNFRRELVESRPAFVVISGDWRMVNYTEGERIALQELVVRRGYRRITFAGCEFAVRPDRVEAAR